LKEDAMKKENGGSILLTALIIVGIIAAGTGMAQNAAPPSLKDQLEAQYTLTKTAFSSGQLTITQPGTVLVIQQAGIEGVPPGSLTMAPAICKDGVLKPPSKKAKWAGGIMRGASNPFSKSSGVSDSRDLAVGEKVYVSKLDVNVNKDTIGFRIIECDSCNGVTQPSSNKGEVIFEFTKGSLANPSVTDIEDTIAKVFTVDNSAQATQAQQAPAQPEQPAAQQQTPAQPPAPAQIQLGQTTDEVVKALGQPEKIVDLGPKKIYVYKDLKITFTNGKVSDVQ
jgi:hypothetical protein